MSDRAITAMLFQSSNNLMNLLKLFLSASFLFQLPTAWAADFTPVCPSSIDVEQKIVGVPNGWQSSAKGGDNAKSRLENVEFSDGDPINQYILAPDSGKKTKGTDTETWTFEPGMKNGFWLSFMYSQTNVLLTQNIPDNVKSCSVTYDTHSSEWVLKNIKCK